MLEGGMTPWLSFPLRLWLDLYFPPRCFGCGEEGEWICPVCAQKTAAEWSIAKVRDCLPQPFLYLTSYRPGVVRETIHALKYQHIREAASSLIELAKTYCSAEELKQLLYADLPPQTTLLLVPVPTSSAHYKQRGYNQAELLAWEIGTWLDLPVYSRLLRRRSQSGSQVGRSSQQRQAAINQAFARFPALPSGIMQNSKLILVDDICTTGSTLQGCVQELQPLTAFPVGGLVIAKEE